MQLSYPEFVLTKKTMQVNPKVQIYDDGYAFHHETGESFFINDTGHEILNLIQQGSSTEEIIQHFTQHYDITEIEFERYFYDFINELKKNKIILE